MSISTSWKTLNNDIMQKIIKQLDYVSIGNLLFALDRFGIYISVNLSSNII